MNQYFQDSNTELEEELTSLVTNLYDNLTCYQQDNNNTTTNSYINDYIKSVTRIGFRLGKSNYVALRDYCVIYRDILNTLVSTRSELTPSEHEKLEVWPTLILSYLSCKSDKNIIDQLLDFIEDTIWDFRPLPNDLQQLKKEFYAEMSSLPEINIPESFNTFDGIVLESIQQEIIDAMSDLLSDLESMDPDDDFGFSHALSLCADRIELLGMSIATAGMLGLMDVCNIFQSGLRVLSNRESIITAEERNVIEEWPAHLIAYLSSPSDIEVTDNLINYLARIPWINGMSDDEKDTLREILIAEDIEVTALTDFDDNIETTNENFDSHSNHNHEKNDVVSYESAIPQNKLSTTDNMYYLGQELIKLIRDEFELEKSSLEQTLENLKPSEILSGQNIEQISLYKLIIERFMLATESIGLTGLNKIIVFLNDNLSHIIEKDTVINEHILSTLKSFPDSALNYLSNMDHQKNVDHLLTPFFMNDWPILITYHQNDLTKELLSPSLLIEDDIEIRATEATLDDISLTLPGDVNQQLLDSLLQELPVQTAEFTSAITHLVEGHANMHDVEKAQRIAHTLKGAANTVGVSGIATLTHHIEDIFDAFTKHQRLPGKKLSDTLMNAADVLEAMSEALLGQGELPEQAQSVLQQVLDWANLIDQEGIPEDDAVIKISHETSAEDESKPGVQNQHSDLTSASMLRVPASLMDNLLRLAGESIILGGQLQERLKHALHQTHLAHKQNELYQHLMFELEQIVDIQGLTNNKQDSKLNEIFDSLELEHYNELHTVTHQLVEAATDSKELTQSIEDELNELNSLLIDQGRLHKENQDIVMQTRMIPVQSIVPRLQRSIRQTCRFTNKKVNLTVHGTTTLMDSDVLDELIDPLMHILRNSVDHGIEEEKIRISKNKNEHGNINLSFSRDGDQIVVQCADDGSGLDFGAIRTTALEKNIISEDQEISDEELIRFIWLAGFTTRQETTQVSGRGIGMDAVYSKITALKGELNISSIKDKGCTVELRLPLTLISVHAILVKLRNQTLAISNRGIEQILSPDDGELILDKNTYKYSHNDEIFDAYDIETLLHQSRGKQEMSEKRTVLLVRDETGNKIAVSVDHVIGNQDLVVKQLGKFIPDIMGIEGATILGNGNVAPVLDLPGLIRTIANNDIKHIIERIAENEEIQNNIVALVVDDSLSARRSLAEFVKDLGYEVHTARDGIEALESIESSRPDIILADLEMPRMNGLELTSHVRSKSDTRGIPVIMITSRSTEKHREMAYSAGVNAYLTKPFSEEQLLEHIQNLLLTVH